MSYKLVPVEPTQEMLEPTGLTTRCATELWQAMLSASPKVQIDEGMVQAGYRAYVEACANELSISVEDLVRRVLLAALTPEQEG